MASDAFDLLLRMASASTFALLLVLALRRRLRSAFGPAVAYQLWLLVPVAMLACLLPAARITNAAVMRLMPSGATPDMAGGAVIVVVADWSGVALSVWLAGAFAASIAMVASHRRFIDRLGKLAARDGIHYAAHAQASPSLLGLIAPVIVVPADFLTRYGPAERSLIVAHERQHARRRDPLANAAAAFVQCLFWFNPIVYLALGRFRFDQELACDADVMAAHPGQAKVYAQAMLKTQMAGTPSLATCHWQSSHPLKERILNLQSTPFSTARRVAGRLLVVLMAASCIGITVAARADSVAADAPMFNVAVSLILPNGSASPAIPSLMRAGETVRVGAKDNGIAWDSVFSVSDDGNGLAMMKGVISKQGEVHSKPIVKMVYGETARIKVHDGVSGFEVTLVVTKAAKGAPAS